MTESSSKQRPVRVGMISLGCAKNLVDAEIMLGNLIQNGVEIINDATQADAVIVNTCSFIDAAQEESVDTILESAAVREVQNRDQALIVAGCLPQRFREELPKLIPEVDAFMGIDQVASVNQVLHQAMERRAAKRSTPDRARRRGRGTIAAQLAELDAHAPEGEPSAVRSTQPPRPTRFRDLPSETASPRAEPASGAKAAPEPYFQVDARPRYIPDYATPRFRLTPGHFAYLKIAEGCNHPCSFCIIPRMRGSHRSRAQSDVVAEARQLLADGVKEINLISQDSTYYGLDLRPRRNGSIAAPDRFRAAAADLPADHPTLCSLLRQLDGLEGDFWIRLLYTHPAHWTEALIETLAACPKVARYIDLPLQHIHPAMLERMRRETSREYIVGLIRRIRAGIPGIVLRTTFIVGFPGETEQYFESLLEFIRETRFERLGVFAYSREAGTPAGKMAGQVPDQIKQERRERAMAEQARIARDLSASAVGKEMNVLVEGKAGAKELDQAGVHSWEHGLIRADGGEPRLPSGRYWVARGEGDAPDIDGRVYLRGWNSGGKGRGHFARVRIVGHTDYDLIGEA